jgi:hypothetical protein
MEKDNLALDYVLDMFINPSLERVTSKFKKLNQDLAGYNIEPKYKLLMTNPNQHKQDLSYEYIRCLRIYQFLIHPENIAIFESMEIQFVKIYIEKLTKLLTPSIKHISSDINNPSPPLELLSQYLDLLLKISPDQTLKHIMEQGTLFCFFISTPTCRSTKDKLKTTVSKIKKHRPFLED